MQKKESLLRGVSQILKISRYILTLMHLVRKKVETGLRSVCNTCLSRISNLENYEEQTLNGEALVAPVWAIKILSL